MVGRHPFAADAALALVLAAAGVISVVTVHNLIRGEDPPSASRGPWPAWWRLVVTLPLAWRRRFPLVVAVVVTGAFIVNPDC